MTPEMMSVLAVPSAGEAPVATHGDQPQTTGTANLQSANSSFSQIPSTNDPFSISKNRVNGEVRPNFGSSALFEKLSSKKIHVTPVGGGGAIDVQEFDSPIAPGGTLQGGILPARDQEAVAVLPVEPPHAPVRKVRTLQGMNMDFTAEEPPKMRSNSIRSKSRIGESDDFDAPRSRSSTLNTGIGERKRTVSGQPLPSMSSASISNLHANPNEHAAPQRKSERLLNQIRPKSGKFASATGSMGTREGRELKKAKATLTKGRSANAFNVGRVVSGNRKHGEAMEMDAKEQRPLAVSQNAAAAPNPKPVISEKVKELEGLQWLIELFVKLGSGYYALSQYRTHDTIQILNNVTPSQRETPWVLSQIGRAFYEEGSYPEAEKYFARIKSIAPSRLEDMEIYSTVLWHQKSTVDLAYLAHSCIDIDRTSPEAWCAVGNSFSHVRDHDNALKCFKRATQLYPGFAYAFTLQGHEHIANEEYDKAMLAYRKAIAAEDRHYNAWYGLGRVYEKQGKYPVAEQHYRTAVMINPTNAVLVCCVGSILEKQKNPRAAYLQYDRATQLSPKSALSRFKKARVLLTLGEMPKALTELKVLKDIVPDEPNVHFLLGKVYKSMRESGLAVKHFTTALNLDPKVCPRSRHD